MINLNIQNLFPELNDKTAKKAKSNLNEYLAVVLDIFEQSQSKETNKIKENRATKLRKELQNSNRAILIKKDE
ncbi:hypothetical protein CL633_01280 [bacterium]|nr:hypothetical protein [bacterium]|tara:strand:- start:588 stop:806 length:219 start_codon:yes stop_codon:yes gene_type:complete